MQSEMPPGLVMLRLRCDGFVPQGVDGKCDFQLGNYFVTTQAEMPRRVKLESRQ